jgi:hypothetical protein
LNEISVLAPAEIPVLRGEIIRHGERAARFAYRLLAISAAFVLLTETHGGFKFAGVPVHNVALVLKVIPPVVGFMLIQVVDSLFIRQKYIGVLESLIRETMPRVSAAHLGYVFVPYNFPSSDMVSEHDRAARCLNGLEAFTNILAVLFICGFLIFAVYSLNNRFGARDALADASVFITAVAGVRVVSGVIGMGIEN